MYAQGFDSQVRGSAASPRDAATLVAPAHGLATSDGGLDVARGREFNVIWPRTLKAARPRILKDARGDHVATKGGTPQDGYGRGAASPRDAATKVGIRCSSSEDTVSKTPQGVGHQQPHTP